MPQSEPIIVRVIEDPGTTIGDVMLSAIGITGVMVLGALLIGLLLGAIFIGFRKFLPRNQFNGDSSGDLSLRLNSPNLSR